MKLLFWTIAFSALLLQFCGCSEYKSNEAIFSSESFGLLKENEESILAGSLFAEDQAVISNEAINQILSSEIVIPEKSKMAILRFTGTHRWSYWSEQLLQLDQESMDQFINKLKTSKRLKEASCLPSMIISKNMTVSLMRAAAARTQSDLMLVYKITTNNFEKYRLIGKKEAKAYSTVEAILIDVRTGTIPFSTMATETHSIVKTAKDLDFYETVLKSQQQATGKALAKIANDIVKFLDEL